MTYKIYRVEDTSELDSVPVAVIKDYPLEKRDYKPYAPAILCRTLPSLILRMWAVEVSPPQGSELLALLGLFGDGTAPLLAAFTPGDGFSLSLMAKGGAARHPLPEGLILTPHSGEDLQGIYWGGTAVIPLNALEKIGGGFSLLKGSAFPGNFYKLCPGPQMAHQGSFFPADFKADPFSPGSMGKLLVI
ncbi:MAG: hypothetical protein LBU86_00490 [Oscillospiraceae bacterium]|jgi:hypothetical protein|nr:hypothetical protein [Oscillospiraceae bacterium]